MSVNKSKICFLAATLGKGGAEKQAYYFLKTLRENGHRLKVIYFEPEDWWKAPILDLGVDVVHVAAASKKARVREVYRILKKEKFDIIQALHYHMNPYAGFLALLLGAKSVGAFRGDGERELLTVNKHVRNVAFRLGGAFICNSQSTLLKLSVVGSLKNKLHYLPNVVEIPESADTNQSELPTKFLCVNSLVNLKRVDHILRFIASYSKINPATELKILGDGPLRKELEDMALTLEIESNVSFEGQVDNVADYFRKADVFLFASQSEGTPNVVLEAMSHAKVIITSDVGDTRFLVQHGISGHILNFEDEKQIASTIQWLYHDWSNAKKLGTVARDSILANNSFSQLYKNLHAIYQQV